MRLLVLNASTPSGIEAAFVTLTEERVRLLLVSGDSFLVAQREQLVALAARHAVPTLYHRREFTAVGGLMSYGPPLSEAYYHVGNYTGRILKGEKPANMPVYQSAKFDLVINLKTAKALGIELPPDAARACRRGHRVSCQAICSRSLLHCTSLQLALGVFHCGAQNLDAIGGTADIG
jgi:putative ABC transport system substrate-binding protein